MILKKNRWTSIWNIYKKAMQQHFGHMNMLMYADCDIQLSLCSQVLVIIKQITKQFQQGIKEWPAQCKLQTRI